MTDLQKQKRLEANETFESKNTTCEHIDTEFATENTNCLCNISNCIILKKFSIIMNRYNRYNHDNKQHDNFMDSINISEIVDEFFHLMHHHNNDKDFECIYNKLSCCDIGNCDAFIRNNRNRLKTQFKQVNQQTKMEKIAWYQIMDKIHCYFQHCYDIGNKLLMQNHIKAVNDDTKYDNDPFHLV
eukprot:17542_1